MKTKKLVIIIQANNKKVYQVFLKNNEAKCIMGVLQELHNGTIKCMKEELSIDIKTLND